MRKLEDYILSELNKGCENVEANYVAAVLNCFGHGDEPPFSIKVNSSVK
jgi:hypothetical protein